MKKVIPFIFPAVALLVVLLLAYRWFRLNAGQVGTGTADGQDVVIEDLNDADTQQILKGAGDYKTVEMKGDENVQGSVRYEIKDGKVRFSVMADLAAPEKGFYQVWVKSGTRQTKAFRLEEEKVGYMGSAAIAQSDLPADVIVSLEQVDDSILEKTVLSGSVKE